MLANILFDCLLQQLEGCGFVHNSPVLIYHMRPIEMVLLQSREAIQPRTAGGAGMML
jgi:hypothetical protein